MATSLSILGNDRVKCHYGLLIPVMLFRSSGRLQNGRGANEVLTLQKEGAGKVVAILKGALEVLTILEGEATKGFHPLNGERCKNFYPVLRGGGHK